MYPAPSLAVDPFLQECPALYTKKDGLGGREVRSIALDGRGRIWFGTESGVACYDGSAWRHYSVSEGLPHPSVRALLFDGQTLWAGTEGGLAQIEEDRFKPVGPSSCAVHALASGPDALWAATSRGVFRFRENRWEAAGEEGRHSGLKTIAAGPDGSLWGGGEKGLSAWNGKEWKPAAEGTHPASPGIRALCFDRAGHLWAGTAAGIDIYLGSQPVFSYTGREGLPYDDIRCLARGPKGEWWIGTGIGAIRFQDGEWHYYQGRRYLPEDEVLSLAVAPDGTAWIGTTGGVSRIEARQMTLEEKARHFETLTQKWHYRSGYIACGVTFTDPEDETRYVQEAADNDGLWTALYTAAESFRWAVTGDPEARRMARETCRALRLLEEATGIPGFPARSVVTPEEIAGPDPRTARSGGEWHPSPDGKWLWKGDTSSDELDGHYFAFAIYYDLAADEQEKAAVRETVRRITDYIIAHDYLLIDADGEPTTWGVWGPKYLNDDPQWRQETGLNSLEILSHLKAAHHITGDSKYEQAARELIEKHHYAINTICQKITTPGEINHSDDELAFLAYYPLLRYETDPGLRAVYLAGLERSWRIERPERSPLWNFIYGACSGKPCDAEAAARTLMEVPLSTRNFASRNSHRKDLRLDEDAGRFGEPQSLEVLPYNERYFTRWNGNPYRLDTGGDGRSQDDGAFYLLPYWLGRYHRLIAPK